MTNSSYAGQSGLPITLYAHSAQKFENVQLPALDGILMQNKRPNDFSRRYRGGARYQTAKYDHVNSILGF